jgi:hypothetical protein
LAGRGVFGLFGSVGGFEALEALRASAPAGFKALSLPAKMSPAARRFSQALSPRRLSSRLP